MVGTLAACRGSKPVSFSNDEMDISDKGCVNWYGRTYADKEDGSMGFDYTCSGFEVTFFGTSLTARMKSSKTTVVSGTDYSWVNVYLDGAMVETSVLEISSEQYADFELAADLDEGRHTVKVLKRTEAQFSTLSLSALSTDGHFETPPAKSGKKIEVYGDSITCGYGSVSAVGASGFKTATEDGTRTYAAMAANWLGAQCSVIGYSGWRLANYWPDAGLTVPDVYDRVYSPLRGVDAAWNMSDYVPDVVIVNLGTNDYAQCAASAQTNYAFGNEQGEIFQNAYRDFIAKLQKSYPKAQIILCNGAMLTDTVPWEKEIVKELNAAGNTSVHYVQLYQTAIGKDNGTDGHPHWTAHYESAGLLYAKIKSITGW